MDAFYRVLSMAPQGGDGGGQLLSTLIMFGVIGGIIYIVIRAINKKNKPKIKKVKKKQIKDL